KLDSDEVMLLNLSCLVAKDKVAGLGEELEKINNMEGFSVHFSGPWPPYSFVARPIVAGEKEGSDESH
ncbi:MAG TPA: GvpL/GvpF family gas vesicle protein, partial [Dehalococcoidales bacterium]